MFFVWLLTTIWCLGVAAIKNHTPPVFSCVVWLLSGTKKLITFQNFKPKRVNKLEMLQNFSQTQGTVFHSSACISSSEGFFKNRSAHFCGKSPSSGACPSQIAILFSLGLKFLMKWKPTYIYGELNFSDSQQVFANLFSWWKLEGSLIISWKFQGRTPEEIWITAIFPARSKVVSYDVLHHNCSFSVSLPRYIFSRFSQYLSNQHKLFNYWTKFGNWEGDNEKPALWPDFSYTCICPFVNCALYTVQSLPKVKSLPHFFCIIQWVDCSNFSQIERLCTKILYSFCRTKKCGLQRLKELL